MLLPLFISFSFGQFVVNPSSIYRLWLPVWCLHTLHKHTEHILHNQIFVCGIICLWDNSLVFINDIYIDVLGSFTFATLSYSLTPGKRVCMYIPGIMTRSSYLLRKVYVVTMTWLAIRKTSVTNVPFVVITIVHSFPHLCLYDESRYTATCCFCKDDKTR